VTIEDGASVEDSIILEHAVIGKGCRLKRVIVDKFNVFPEGFEAGSGERRNRLTSGCHVDETGIVVIPKGRGRTG
jgi:ADP-glucose pyrophosphorylase